MSRGLYKLENIPSWYKWEECLHNSLSPLFKSRKRLNFTFDF